MSILTSPNFINVVKTVLKLTGGRLLSSLVESKLKEFIESEKLKFSHLHPIKKKLILEMERNFLILERAILLLSLGLVVSIDLERLINLIILGLIKFKRILTRKPSGPKQIPEIFKPILEKSGKELVPFNPIENGIKVKEKVISRKRCYTINKFANGKPELMRILTFKNVRTRINKYCTEKIRESVAAIAKRLTKEKVVVGLNELQTLASTTSKVIDNLPRNTKTAKELYNDLQFMLKVMELQGQIWTKSDPSPASILNFKKNILPELYIILSALKDSAENYKP